MLMPISDKVFGVSARKWKPTIVSIKLCFTEALSVIFFFFDVWCFLLVTIVLLSSDFQGHNLHPQLKVLFQRGMCMYVHIRTSNIAELRRSLMKADFTDTMF